MTQYKCSECPRTPFMYIPPVYIISYTGKIHEMRVNIVKRKCIWCKFKPATPDTLDKFMTRIIPFTGVAAARLKKITPKRKTPGYIAVEKHLQLIKERAAKADVGGDLTLD